MIALTQEKREELKAFLSASIEKRCTVYTLAKQRELEALRDQIALESLTATHDYNRCFCGSCGFESFINSKRCPSCNHSPMANELLFTAPPVQDIKLPESLLKISNNLNAQDNRITDQPMFIVYQKKEIIGSDDHSPSRIVWLVDGEEVSETKARRLEVLHQEFREIDSKYQRYAAQEVDEFVTACFTEQGCKDFLSINGHNLRRPFIFAEGSFRNHEYQTVRNWLISLNGLGE